MRIIKKVKKGLPHIGCYLKHYNAILRYKFINIRLLSILIEIQSQSTRNDQIRSSIEIFTCTSDNEYCEDNTDRMILKKVHVQTP